MAQLENIALNKPAWSTTNHTFAIPSSAMDGYDDTATYITTDEWPFLAIDLGGRYKLVTTVVMLFSTGECLLIYVHVDAFDTVRLISCLIQHLSIDIHDNIRFYTTPFQQ